MRYVEKRERITLSSPLLLVWDCSSPLQASKELLTEIVKWICSFNQVKVQISHPPFETSPKSYCLFVIRRQPPKALWRAVCVCVCVCVCMCMGATTTHTTTHHCTTSSLPSPSLAMKCRGVARHTSSEALSSYDAMFILCVPAVHNWHSCSLFVNIVHITLHDLYIMVYYNWLCKMRKILDDNFSPFITPHMYYTFTRSFTFYFY